MNDGMGWVVIADDEAADEALLDVEPNMDWMKDIAGWSSFDLCTDEEDEEKLPIRLLLMFVLGLNMNK